MSSSNGVAKVLQRRRPECPVPMVLQTCYKGDLIVLFQWCCKGAAKERLSSSQRKLGALCPLHQPRLCSHYTNPLQQALHKEGNPASKKNNCPMGISIRSTTIIAGEILDHRKISVLLEQLHNSIVLYQWCCCKGAAKES